MHSVTELRAHRRCHLALQVASGCMRLHLFCILFSIAHHCVCVQPPQRIRWPRSMTHGCRPRSSTQVHNNSTTAIGRQPFAGVAGARSHGRMLGRSTVQRGPEGPAHAKRAPTAWAALAGPACRPDSPHGRPVLLRVWGSVRRGFQQSFCPPPVPRGGSKQCPCSKARVQATHTSIFRAWICLDTQAYFAYRRTLLLHISIFEFVTTK